MRLLTGVNGMIGRNITELLPPMLCPTHSELDLTDRKQVQEYLDCHKPEQIIHCASNDGELCLYDNLRMFTNLADSEIPMVIFATGRDIEDRPGKVGEYILSKYIAQELALHKYNHIVVLKIWGCFGKYEKETRFFTDNMIRIKRGEPILVRENRFFSYVYVKDLARIIRLIVSHKDLSLFSNISNVIAYSHSLEYYAKILKRVTSTDLPIIVENKSLINPYIGEDTFNFYYTSLSTALKEMWDAFDTDTFEK